MPPSTRPAPALLSWTLAATLALAFVLQAASPAHAEVSVGVGTDFPIDLAARVDYESPDRLRLSFSLGYMPEAYAQATTDILVALGAWSEDTGDLVMQALRSSLVVRAHAGWRPFADSGFYFALGYGVAALGGGTSRGSIIGGVTGFTPPLSASSGDYQIATVMHLFDIELGWEWHLSDHLLVRVALGGAFTVGASVDITPPELSIPIIESSFADDSAAYLRDLIVKNVHTPTLTVGAAYSF